TLRAPPATQRARRSFVPLLLLSLLAVACSPDSMQTTTAPPGPALDRVASTSSRADRARALEAVFAGNAQSIAAAPALVPPGVPLAPFIEARLYAIANIAMHDALNGIAPRFDRYADAGAIERHANAAAAILTAAHDAIVGAAPGAKASTDAWYASNMAALAGGSGVADGVSVGHRAAAAILAKRAADGVAAGGVAPYHPGSHPGDYQFTFPFNTPGPPFFGGFADGTIWASTVTPFAITSASRFRPGPPYGARSNSAAVRTHAYTEDFNEVKRLGCDGCAARSPVQTEIAIFWRENSPTGWNRIARVVAEQRNLNAYDAARLFAVLQMGEFDAYISSLEAKYYYNFWRPVTAVALAATDDNADTSPQANWQVLAFPTPPIPDYPSGHATAGGTAAAIIEALVPGRGPAISTTSGSLPGVTRTFSSVAAAADENALSRIYIGYHFRKATSVGVAQGRAVGRYVAGHALRPLDDDEERDR
ncbi:MAG TPA: vanadium-dependent haloperoxidase, partial [Gemmatimonadaceae bacterium]|nr:vanadium-dependent haloperoxidase [Gemmatimonadaceae bacterium]